MTVADTVVRLTTAVADEVHEDNPTQGRCVEATRLLVDLLRRAHVECRPLAVDAYAANPLGLSLTVAGVDPSLWPPEAWSVGIVCDRVGSEAARSTSEPYRRREFFAGHLLVAGDGWFADPTAGQLSRPQHRIFVPRTIVGTVDDGFPEGGIQSGSLKDGGRLEYRWRPEVKAWRNTPAWRQDVEPELLDRIGAS